MELDTSIEDKPKIGATYEYPVRILVTPKDNRTTFAKMFSSPPPPRYENTMRQSRLVSVTTEGNSYNGGYRLQFEDGGQVTVDYGDENQKIIRFVSPPPTAPPGGKRKQTRRRRNKRKTRKV